MIDMSKFTNNNKDNTIVVNGTEFMVSDKTAEAIMELISGKGNLTAPATQEAPKAEAKGHGVSSNNVSCKFAVEEVLTSGNKKFYRIIDGIFTAGKWRQSKFNADEEYRIPTNLEAHRIATEKIKSLEGIKSVEMPGGWKAYGFTAKKSATAALEHLPSQIQGVEIDQYITKYGKIEAKAVKRQKKS